MSDHANEIASGKRFEFGKNWLRFLKSVDQDRILEAEKSLQSMLEMKDLSGKRFLDIGSGSGLFSLAARSLGASVHSFDYDPNSVECTRALKKRYFSNDVQWTIESGSILDRDYIYALGKFDVVYSWGVLHHTGAMWQALENATLPLVDQGKLYISIYNDQGGISRFWRGVKRFYCSGIVGKVLVSAFFCTRFFLRGFFYDLVCMKNPIKRYQEYRKLRGMSIVTDWIDWLGGYPFEVAKPEEIFHFFKEKGYCLQQLKTCGGGLACNVYVFSKDNKD